MRCLHFATVLLLLSAAVIHPQTPKDNNLSTLTKSMESAPPEQRLAFNALLVAFTTFRDAHLRHKVCIASEDCTVRRSSERATLDLDFTTLARGSFDPATSEDLTTADETLNNYFQKVSAILPDTCPGSDCLSKGTFREVQRDWIRYRDAWAIFGAAHSPGIPSEKWRIYLTEQREKQMLARFPILCCA